MYPKREIYLVRATFPDIASRAFFSIMTTARMPQHGPATSLPVTLVSAFHCNKPAWLAILNDCDMFRNRLAAHFRFKHECQQVEFSFRDSPAGVGKIATFRIKLRSRRIHDVEKILGHLPSQILTSWVPNRIPPAWTALRVFGDIVILRS